MDMGSLNNRAGVGAVAPAARTNEMTAASGAAQATEARKNEGIAEPDRERVLAAMAEMQDYVQAAQHNIQFQLDDDSGRMVVKVTEANSGEVIRQIPSEEALRLAANLAEMSSVLFRGEV